MEDSLAKKNIVCNFGDPMSASSRPNKLEFQKFHKICERSRCMLRFLGLEEKLVKLGTIFKEQSITLEIFYRNISLRIELTLTHVFWVDVSGYRGHQMSRTLFYIWRFPLITSEEI